MRTLQRRSGRAEAQSLREFARDPTCALGLGDLALRLLGPVGLTADVYQEQDVRVVGGRICIRADLPDECVAEAVAFGLARWWAEQIQEPLDDRLDEIAMTLLYPPSSGQFERASVA